MNKKYRSKIDLWYKVVIFLTIALMASCMFWVSGIDFIALGGIFIVISIFLLFILFHTNYTLHDDYIDIWAGILHTKIKYDDIATVSYSTNIYSSAALSKDRIEIKEKDKGFILGTTYISPVEKEEVYNILNSKINKN